MENNNNDFLKNWLEGNVSPEELRLRKENGDLTVQQFDELVTRSSGMRVPDSVSKEASWKKLSAKLTAGPKEETKVVKIDRWVQLSIAASISLFVIVLFVLNKTTITTQLAETKVHVLPDGSEVTLNADSKITVPRFAWLGERTVTLEGEAFFKVTKGNSFTVETTNGNVYVLGTSFNVNARLRDFEVSCFTGKVKVVSGEKEILLTKGLFTKLDRNVLIPAETFEDSKTTWRDGDFYFEGKPLTAVMSELERQFGVEITFTGDGARLYTGYFNNKNLDEALEMVCKPMSLSFQREDNNKILIK